MPSSKILEQKKRIVKELSEKIGKAKSIILADYRGVTVEEDTKLRSSLRKEKVEYRVVKNTFLWRAVKENGLEELEQYMHGPTSVAISYDDPVAPAKILMNYSKENDKFQVKAGILEGKIIDMEKIKELASLPSKDVLVSKVLGGLKSPMYGLVNVLNANIRGLVTVLDAIAQKQKAAG